MGHAPFIVEALSRWRSFLSRWTRQTLPKSGDLVATSAFHALPVLSKLRGEQPAAPQRTPGRNFEKPAAAHLALGRRGEKLAAHHLRKHGYKILLRNFRGARGGEIDIVCRHDDTLVFVEVKTRSGEDYGRPFEAVDNKKRRRIVRGAMAWLRMLDMPDISFRFDVVEVLADDPPEITVIENAFGMPRNYYY